MLALEIRFLTGRYAAARVTDRSEPEWPPHPARVFSALTAALHDDPEPPEREVQALEWLEQAGHPDVVASDAGIRALVQVYVPANDQRALASIDRYVEDLANAEEAIRVAEGADRTRAERRVRKAEAKLLEQSQRSAAADGKGTPALAAEVLNRRLRPRPRPFPVAIPHDDRAYLVWPTMPTDDVREALDAVASRVSRLGHSSSLVSLRVTDADAAESVKDAQRWTPSEGGDRYLRSVTGAGHLAALQEAHQRHLQVEQHILPAESVLYRASDTSDLRTEAVPTWFANGDRDWIVFRVVHSPADGTRPRHDVSLAQHIARAMRGLLLSHLDPARSPAVLTGHLEDGRPATETHLAFVPLPDVRYDAGDATRHATGTILGLALIPPASLNAADRELLIDAVYRAEQEARSEHAQPRNVPPEPPVLRLTMGRHGVALIQRTRSVTSPSALTTPRWVTPATRWVTATPIALSRNPGDLRSRDPRKVERAIAAAEEIVAAECEHIGLSPPSAVWIHRRSLVSGAPAAHRFMPFPANGNGPKRVCVHAELHFDTPVRGPVILGAGRYFGLGLCVPAGGAS